MAAMLSKKQVDFFAHQSGIQDQEVAEREIVLTYALQMLSEEESTLADDGKSHRERRLWESLSDSCRNRKATGEF